MANLTIRSRRGEDGLIIHPVARVRVTIPASQVCARTMSAPHFNAGHRPSDCDDRCLPTVIRFTLRSDGAILRSVYIPAWSYSRAKWTGHTKAYQVRPDRLATVLALPVHGLTNIISRIYAAGCTVEPEAI
jgi:hypothetical protein